LYYLIMFVYPAYFFVLHLWALSSATYVDSGSVRNSQVHIKINLNTHRPLPTLRRGVVVMYVCMCL
jgi:hypothetical protein